MYDCMRVRQCTEKRLNILQLRQGVRFLFVAVFFVYKKTTGNGVTDGGYLPRHACTTVMSSACLLLPSPASQGNASTMCGSGRIRSDREWNQVLFDLGRDEDCGNDERR